MALIKPTLDAVVAAHETIALVDWLHLKTGLSKSKLKDALQKGAVWWLQRQKANQRLRRASYQLKAGQRIALYYDADLLARQAAESQCILDKGRFSVWYKPAGVLSQGNWYGDHCSIVRQVSKHFEQRRDVFLVHRLDREAQGLMLLAHDKRASAVLGDLFQQRRIIKQYHIEVQGCVTAEQGVLNMPLDGKAAQTRFKRLAQDVELGRSLLEITLDSGRKHQIRRHFAEYGFPVLGDPLYGQHNKNAEGLRLVAVRLAFDNPLDKQSYDICLPDALNPLLEKENKK